LVRGGQERPDSGLRSDARRNQQRILRAAARLLAADPASTIQQIADEAEVARPTVYRRYPTREALVEAIIAEATAEFAVALDDVASQAGSAAEAIGQLIRQLARISADYPILLSGPDGAHPPGDGTRREMAALVSRFDAQIARGQQDRSVRTDLAPEVLRHSLFGRCPCRCGCASSSRPAPGSARTRSASKLLPFSWKGCGPVHPPGPAGPARPDSRRLRVAHPLRVPAARIVSRTLASVCPRRRHPADTALSG
jgi:AcrR family transcriptional regulator